MLARWRVCTDRPGQSDVLQLLPVSQLNCPVVTTFPLNRLDIRR